MIRNDIQKSLRKYKENLNQIPESLNRIGTLMKWNNVKISHMLKNANVLVDSKTSRIMNNI